MKNSPLWQAGPAVYQLPEGRIRRDPADRRERQRHLRDGGAARQPSRPAGTPARRQDHQGMRSRRVL